MARRRFRLIRPAERVLLIIEFAMIAAMISLGLISDQQLLGGLALIWSLMLWAAILLVAPTVLVLELVNGRECSKRAARRR